MDSTSIGWLIVGLIAGAGGMLMLRGRGSSDSAAAEYFERLGGKAADFSQPLDAST